MSDQIEKIDRSLADIQVMGHVAIRAAQNLRCSENDPEYYRLPEQETTMLLFSVHDVLDRIEKLRAELEVAAEPANVKAAPDERRLDEADASGGGVNKNQILQMIKELEGGEDTPSDRTPYQIVGDMEDDVTSLNDYGHIVARVADTLSDDEGAMFSTLGYKIVELAKSVEHRRGLLFHALHPNRAQLLKD
jgi:hypothetical protein